MPCPTRTGATAFPSAEWLPSTRIRAASFRPAEWGSTSPAACARCIRVSRWRTSSRSRRSWPIACSSHPRGRRQHRRDQPLGGRWTPCCAAGRTGQSSAAGARREDLERIEEYGCMAGAEPEQGVGARQEAPARRDGYARLGQPLSRGAVRREILDRPPRRGLRDSRVATSSSASTAARAVWATRSAPSSCATWRSRRRQHGITLPDRELACAPINSATGHSYLGRHARGHQLRAGQPPDPYPSDARSVRGGRAQGSLRCSTTYRTIPARSRSTSWTASRASSTCIAKARRVPSARAIPTCRRRCATWASRC